MYGCVRPGRLAVRVCMKCACTVNRIHVRMYVFYVCVAGGEKAGSYRISVFHTHM